MARLGFPRRKPCRFCTVRTILLAVPAVWIVMILWTMYNAQSVNQRQALKRLTFKQGQENALLPDDVVVMKEDNPDIEIPQVDEPDHGSKHTGDKVMTKDSRGHPEHVADDDQLLAQQADIGHQVLEADNFDHEGARESEVDNPEQEDGEDFGDSFMETDEKNGLQLEDPDPVYPVPGVIQDFLDRKNRSGAGRMMFVQPESPDWDSSVEADHVEFVWRGDKPRPEKKILAPGVRFDPPKLGERGRPLKVEVSSLSPEERAKYDEGWRNHQYNEYVSLQISTQRETPDYRPNECKDKPQRAGLPKASIIICFYNEAWSVLLRTIHSVLTRSPPHLVEEVILVDDFSDMVTMHEPLEYYVAQVDKLRLLRMTKRSGLVRARLAGTKEANGPVLIFLDSHVECAEGWLEPLLETILDHPKNAVTPEIDVIDHKDFSIQAAVDNIGVLDFKTFSFDWAHIMPRIRQSLHFEADPIPSPTMAGGLFAIRKDYFIALGTYDPGLELWGGENIEISLKLWMCGGGILIHPCSRVAHIFRDSSPYLRGEKANVLVKNTARVAQVWADQYRDLFFRGTPYNEEKYGSVKERQDLRLKLKCHSFGWYIENIYPELYIEGNGRYKGKISSETGLCVHKTRTETNAPLVLVDCKRASRWELTGINEIRALTNCMEKPSGTSHVVSKKCDLQGENQEFQYTENKTIYHSHSKTCLTASHSGTSLTFQPCVVGQLQKWEWPRNPNYIPTS